MGVEIARQLSDLGKSLLLGVGFALLYDALRSLRLLRRRQRGFTNLLDLIYCVLLAVATVSFTLNVGGGELRLFMIFGALGGAAASFLLLSPLLRGIWALWAGVLAWLWRLFRLPWRAAKNFYGKLHKLSKKAFLFARNLFIIKNYRRFARGARRRSEKKEGVYGRAKRAPQRRAGGTFAAGAADTGGQPSALPARGDPRGRGTESGTR
ncbi:MAG: spore cortex biosynthesis protein YabQ [Oscillospiraceae bacterium]|nr:spore cortex biosynthesis protein YabQ [Oscillospiraceae bacterium]